MSSYKITIVCPKCGPQDGEARDDYFGRHQYGYWCSECQNMYREEEVVNREVRVYIYTEAEGE